MRKRAPAKKPAGSITTVSSQIGRMLDGTFAPGNRIWEAVSTAGRSPIFQTEEALWASCVEYFEWVTENPLTEAKVFPTKEAVRIEMLPRLRAMTIGGLCLFLDISTETWRGWKTEGHALYRAEFIAVIRRVEQIVFEQKFAAASAGLLNANIISRELGLAEKIEASGKDGGAIEHKVQARVVMVPPKTAATIETRAMPSEEAE